MITGDLLISWSIRLAMLLFFMYLVMQVQKSEMQGSGCWLKILWTAGFLLTLLHVVAAFQFVHHWSHSKAYLATAMETNEKLGLPYGAGIYFNYLFLVVWAVDVVWTWQTRQCVSPMEKRLITAGRCYLVFIAFNGVVVFTSGWLRIFGAWGTVLLLGVAFFSLKPRQAGNDAE